MAKMIRHGDLALILLTNDNDDLKSIVAHESDKKQYTRWNKVSEDKKTILAEGETTGHAHRIEVPDLSNVDVYSNWNGELIVKAKQDFKVTHEEHKTVELPKGDYQVRRQREFDPDRGFRNVTD